MTLLKSAADEIFGKMAENLGFKVEAGEAADNFKAALKGAKTKDEVDKILQDFKRSLRMEPTQEDWEALANSKKSQLPNTQNVLDQSAIDQAIDHLISAADLFDVNGFEVTASIIDKVINKFAKTKKEKPPKGAAHKAPKGWWDEMAKDVKKKNPEYSKKQISETVGNIWDNELSDKKREKIYKEYGKTKNPNK